MQKQWSSFRITLLLYIIVLILPFSFYFVYTSFETIKSDTKIVRQSSWVAGAIGYAAIQKDDATIKRIDSTLKDIAEWTKANNSSKLYIGARSPSEELSEVLNCWNTNKKNLSAQNSKCHVLAETLAINIEKMVYLKQKKIINVFYISLLIAMMLALLMIYLVRVYIHKQMKKHAIYDHDTHLFNQKYFLAELHTSTERAKRENNPLSMLFIAVDNFSNGQYDAKQKKHLAQKVAHMLSTVTRDSDTVCRFDEDHFTVLMPLVDKTNALHLETRLKEALETHDFHMTPEPEFSFNTTQFENGETEESFVTRSKN